MRFRGLIFNTVMLVLMGRISMMGPRVDPGHWHRKEPYLHTFLAHDSLIQDKGLYRSPEKAKSKQGSWNLIAQVLVKTSTLIPNEILGKLSNASICQS